MGILPVEHKNGERACYHWWVIIGFNSIVNIRLKTKGGFNMTFDKLVEKVRSMASKVDATGRDFLAVQINITGKDSGVFYVEVKDGRINVEPYEYNDRQCAITMSLTDYNKLLDGKLDPVMAFTTGKLKIEGDIGKAVEFSKALK